MEDDEAKKIAHQMLDYLSAQHSDTILKAYFAGQAIRVFVEGDEIRMEAVDLNP